MYENKDQDVSPEAKPFGAAMLDHKHYEEDSERTLTDEKVYTESLMSHEQLENTQLLEGNVINPIVLDREHLEKEYVHELAVRDMRVAKTPPA